MQEVPKAIIEEDKEHEFRLKTGSIFAMLSPSHSESIKMVRQWLKMLEAPDYALNQKAAMLMAVGPPSQLEARRQANFVLEILTKPRAIPSAPRANSRANVRLLRRA